MLQVQSNRRIRDDTGDGFLPKYQIRGFEVKNEDKMLLSVKGFFLNLYTLRLNSR